MWAWLYDAAALQTVTAVAGSARARSRHCQLLRSFLRFPYQGPGCNADGVAPQQYRIRRCRSHSPGPILHARHLHPVGVVVSVPKRSAVETSCRELSEDVLRWFSGSQERVQTYRSVLAPSLMSSNRAWKTAQGGGDIHRPKR